MSQGPQRATTQANDVEIHSGGMVLFGDLMFLSGRKAWFCLRTVRASSRHSPRNQFVARTIRRAGVGTLLFDLFTKEEEAIDIHTTNLRFDIGLLAERLVGATEWIKGRLGYLRVVYFGYRVLPAPFRSPCMCLEKRTQAHQHTEEFGQRQ